MVYPRILDIVSLIYLIWWMSSVRQCHLPNRGFYKFFVE